MTAVQQALGRLFESIENLEDATERQQKGVLRMKQRDMFNGGSNVIDPAVLARKLDATISKVELMLREA